jgi:hypothetical protein
MKTFLYALPLIVLLLPGLALAFEQPKSAETDHGWRANGVFLSSTRISTLKKRIEQKVEPTYTAFLKLQQAADVQLQRQPEVPAEWYVPGFYRDKDGHRRAKASLADDANSAYELALMYRLTDDAKYAESAARLINGWATGVQSMSRKDDSLLSFSYHFPAFLFAADLIKQSPQWPQEQQQRFQQFVRTKALPMNTMDRKNNWGNWGLVLVMASAAYLEDSELFNTGIARWKIFIEEQIANDGHLPHEVGRNGDVGDHGLWYSHFTLMPQTIAAEIARVNGVDLYEYRSPSGRTLRQAFERLAPWAHTPQSFPYYKGQDPAGQKATDYVSYWEILNSRWPHPDATAMLATMRPLTASHSTPHLTLTHGDLLDQ